LKYEDFSLIMTETKTEASVLSCLDSECPEQSVTSSSSSLPPNTMSLSAGSGGSLSRQIQEGGGQDLTSFLIQRACRHSCLANYFYWYLLVECEEVEGGGHKQDLQVQEMYRTVLHRFTESLRRGPPDWQERHQFLERQHKFIDRLVVLVRAVARENVNRKKKIEKLQSLLADSEAFKFNFRSFEPLPFPLDPETRICGLVVDKANLFKSSLMPARLTFVTDKGKICHVILFGLDIHELANFLASTIDTCR
jgi:phosphatidylinositol 3-kinase